MTNPLPPSVRGQPVEGPPRLLAAVLLLLFPVLLTLAGNRLLFPPGIEPGRRLAEERLETAFSQVDADRDPLAYLSQEFQALERTVFTPASPRAAWKKALPIWRRRFPGLTRAVFLDPEGRPLGDAGRSAPPRALARRFAAESRAWAGERRPLSSLVQSFLKGYCGPFFPTDQEFMGRLIFAAAPPEERYVYISRPHPAGQFLLFLDPGRSFRELALADRIRGLRPGRTGMRLTVARYGERARDVGKRISGPFPLPPTFWRVLQKHPQRMAWFGGTLAGCRIIHPSLWIVGATRVVPRAGVPGPVPTGPFLLFGLLLVLVIPPLGGRPAASLTGSVRWRLVGAFLYAAMVPLLVMGLTARSFLADRRNVLEEETHERIERTLLGFDKRFRNHLSRLGDTLAQFPTTQEAARNEGPGSTGQDGFLDRLKDHRERFRFDTVLMFDRTGSSTFSFFAPETPTMMGKQLHTLSSLARQLFHQIRSDEAPGAPSTANSRQEWNQEEFFSPDMKFELLFFNEVLVGDLQTYLCGLPLGNRQGRISHIAFLLWNRQRLEWDYLTRKLPGLHREAGGTEFLIWSPGNPGWEFPADSSRWKLVDRWRTQVTTRNQSFRETIEEGMERLLLTGLRGSMLSRFSLLGLTRDHHIRRELDGIADRFRLFAVTILAGGAFIGFLLSRFFLTPLQELGAGLAAMGTRAFDRRIPVRGDDELAHLADLFNATMGDLADLEVARVAQEHFYPQDPLVLDGCTVWGTCRPTRQLGGDWFAYSAPDPHRILLLIGDVSGHGVGAALVAAMVKGLLAHPATPREPASLLEFLNRMLLATFRRSRMMTCCLAVVDLSNRQLEWANAGQTYPLLVRGGEATFLELPSYPLGSVRHWKARSRKMPLEAGDTVFFYTDGLIESVDRAGVPIGFDRLRSDLPGLLKARPADTLAAVQDWQERQTEGVPAGDDVTCLVVRLP